MECSSRAELNEHRYYVLNPTGRLNIRGHPIVPLYVVQPYKIYLNQNTWYTSTQGQEIIISGLSPFRRIVGPMVDPTSVVSL